MKKVLIFVFMFFLLSPFTVSATPPSSPPGIEIIPLYEYDFYDSFDNPFEGYIDILIFRDDYPETQILNDINQVFTDTYPDPSNVEHLNNGDWISYVAYYKDASVIIHDHATRYIFAEEQYLDIDSIKIVYFDSDGHTIFTTEEIEIVHPVGRQTRFGDISLLIDQQEVDNSYTISSSIIWLLVIYICLYIFIPIIILSVILKFGITALKRIRERHQDI